MGRCLGRSPGMESWLADPPPSGVGPASGFRVSAFRVFSCLGHFLFSNTFPITAKQQKRKLVSLLRAGRLGVGRTHHGKGPRQGWRGRGPSTPIPPPSHPPPRKADSLFCNKQQAAKPWQFLEVQAGFNPGPTNGPAGPKRLGYLRPHPLCLGAATCYAEVNKLWATEKRRHPFIS